MQAPLGGKRKAANKKRISDRVRKIRLKISVASA
jgi:hypothetical protein